MSAASVPQLRRRFATLETWGDFSRVLFVSLSLFAMALPQDEAALVADEEASATQLARPRPRPSHGDGVLPIVRQLVAAGDDEEGLQGGPDDDDFRPSPERACGLDCRGASLWPLAVRTPGTGAGAPPLAVLLQRLHESHPDVTLACPAIQTSVQVLC